MMPFIVYNPTPTLVGRAFIAEVSGVIPPQSYHHLRTCAMGNQYWSLHKPIYGAKRLV